MKSILALVFSGCLCFAAALGFPGLSAAHLLVEQGGCRDCHELGEFAINGLHGMHTECFACHEGPTEEGDVHASACLACHPGKLEGTNAEQCDLIVFHDQHPNFDPSGVSCLSIGCHRDDCAGIPNTTSVSELPCPSEEIYGKGSLEVALLRAFRDNLLSRTPEGQELIALYYRWSPLMVKALEEDEALKEVFKSMIDTLLPVIEQAVE